MIRHAALPMIAGATLLTGAGAAHAQSYQASASASVRYDDNLFRLPPAIKETLPDHGEDVVTYVVVSGGAKTRVGVVAVDVQGAVGQSFHVNNPRVDALDYTIGTTATYLTGQAQVNVAASYLRQPVPFDDASNTRKVTRGSTDINVDASHDLLGDFRLVGRFGYSDTTISGGGLAAYGSVATSFNGGVGYFSGTGNSITLEYSRQQSNGDTTRDVEIGGVLARYRGRTRESTIISHIQYQITGITSLNGSIGYTRHDDRSVFNADFSGVVGDIALNWSPLPRLVIRPAFRRGFSSESRLFSNGIAATRYSVTASEMLFGRLGVKLGLSRENRRFRYDLQSSDPLALGRTEHTTRANAGLSYTTGLKFALGLDYEHVERDSTRVDFPYAADTITFTITRSFGS